MSYVKATAVLPKELLELIQNYVDGEYLYIPRKDINHKIWGENTGTKDELKLRNQAIYEKYQNGANVKILAKEYYLSIKSIYNIILKEKKNIA